MREAGGCAELRGRSSLVCLKVGPCDELDSPTGFTWDAIPHWERKYRFSGLFGYEKKSVYVVDNGAGT